MKTIVQLKHFGPHITNGGNKSSIPNRVGPGVGARVRVREGPTQEVPAARESAQARICCDSPHPGSQIRRRSRFRCPAAPPKTAR